MSFVETYPPGTFNWVDLAASDAARAKTFYAGLFDWRAQELPVGPGTFTMLYCRDHEVASLYQLTPQQRAQGIPSHWMIYVAVASAEETARQAAMLGGQVLVAPFAVADLGRMALLMDPAGAPFAIWQAGRHAGARLALQPGTLAWQELITPDTVQATTFYTQLFGWQAGAEDNGPAMFLQNGRGQAGVKRPLPDAGPTFPHWRVYFTVPECEAGVATAQSLGGRLIVPPGSSPVGRQALMQDVQGAVFGLIDLADLSKWEK